MRTWLRGDDLLERAAIRLNLAPLPVGLTFFGMPAARTLSLAQKLGVLGAVARSPATAEEVARALKLPPRPRSLLDVAGGHGWFAAALCARHEGLRATVVDLAPSAAVGRQIIAENGLSERVGHVEGDMFAVDLGGPHDAALCFDIIHHLSPEQVVLLFGRVRRALRPGATLAVLDMFRDPGRRPRASASFFRLFFHPTSGADIYSREQLAEFLAQAGFGAPRRRRVRSIPDQALYQAEAI